MLTVNNCHPATRVILHIPERGGVISVRGVAVGEGGGGMERIFLGVSTI